MQCNNEKSKLENDLTSILPFGGRHRDARPNLELVPKRLVKNAKFRRLLATSRSNSSDLFLKDGVVAQVVLF
jgi:hypothetical protein